MMMRLLKYTPPADHRRAAADTRAGRGATPGIRAPFCVSMDRISAWRIFSKGSLSSARRMRAWYALLVGLGAQRVHRRALGGVEHARLDQRVVHDAPHLAAQRVYLPHQVALWPCRRWPGLQGIMRDANPG